MTEERQAGVSPDRSAVVVLVSVAVLVAVLWHFGRLATFRELWAPRILGEGAPRADVDLYGYYYLAGSSIVLRLLVPMAIIRWVLKGRLADFGFRLRGTGGLLKIYLVLLAVMLPVLVYASSLESFQNKYPLYGFASESTSSLIAYELAYSLVFLSGEAFWRGFMIFGLAPRFGLFALPIMSLPYAVIHYGKPTPEVLGAIVTAHVLGYLALKHKSFWFGVALHTTIGWTMDGLCLWRKS